VIASETAPAQVGVMLNSIARVIVPTQSDEIGTSRQK
jgi:hypothetical protein